MLSDKRIEQLADLLRKELPPIVTVCDVCDKPIREGDSYLEFQYGSLKLCEECAERELRWK